MKKTRFDIDIDEIISEATDDAIYNAVYEAIYDSVYASTYNATLEFVENSEDEDLDYRHKKKRGGTVESERHHQRGRGAPPAPGMYPGMHPFYEDDSWMFKADHRKRRGGTQPNRAVDIDRWNDEDVYPMDSHWNPRWGCKR